MRLFKKRYINVFTKIDYRMNQLEELNQISIPITAFKTKKLSVTENLIYYLHINLELRYNQIAFLLKRDQRVVRVIYKRAEDKIKHLQEIYGNRN